MKNLFITTAAILFSGLMGLSQNNFLPPSPLDLMFNVHPTYRRSIKKEKLNEARFLSDFIDGYPSNWITTYVSVEIQATCNGKALTAVSASDMLSAEQKNLLSTIDQATYIDIKVKYIYNEPYTFNVENNGIHVSMMVVPEKEAEYAGGNAQLIKYLKENIISKIPETPIFAVKDFSGSNKTVLKKFQFAAVRFIVNEQGEITNIKMSGTSGNQQTDNMLIHVIGKMPKWKAAENLKGSKVKQEFEFNIGNGGC